MRDASRRGDSTKRGAFGAVENVIKYPYGNRFGVGKGTKFANFVDGSSNSVLISEILTNGRADGRTSSSAPAGMNRDVRGALLCPMMGGNSFTGFFPPNSRGTDVTNGCPLASDRQLIRVQIQCSVRKTAAPTRSQADDGMQPRGACIQAV